ncbi:hypothetical protein ABLN67_01265, partial [Mycobacterium tuberculosis]
VLRSVIRFGCLTVSSIGGNGVFAFIVKRFRVFRAPLQQQHRAVQLRQRKHRVLQLGHRQRRHL